MALLHRLCRTTILHPLPHYASKAGGPDCIGLGQTQTKRKAPTDFHREALNDNYGSAMRRSLKRLKSWSCPVFTIR